MNKMTRNQIMKNEMTGVTNMLIPYGWADRDKSLRRRAYDGIKIPYAVTL